MFDINSIKVDNLQLQNITLSEVLISTVDFFAELNPQDKKLNDLNSEFKNGSDACYVLCSDLNMAQNLEKTAVKNGISTAVLKEKDTTEYIVVFSDDNYDSMKKIVGQYHLNVLKGHIFHYDDMMNQKILMIDNLPTNKAYLMDMLLHENGINYAVSPDGHTFYVPEDKQQLIDSILKLIELTLDGFSGEWLDDLISFYDKNYKHIFARCNNDIRLSNDREIDSYMDLMPHTTRELMEKEGKTADEIDSIYKESEKRRSDFMKRLSSFFLIDHENPLEIHATVRKFTVNFFGQETMEISRQDKDYLKILSQIILLQMKKPVLLEPEQYREYTELSPDEQKDFLNQILFEHGMPKTDKDIIHDYAVKRTNQHELEKELGIQQGSIKTVTIENLTQYLQEQLIADPDAPAITPDPVLAGKIVDNLDLNSIAYKKNTYKDFIIDQKFERILNLNRELSADMIKQLKEEREKLFQTNYAHDNSIPDDKESYEKMLNSMPEESHDLFTC